MAFGQPGGPPATRRQVAELLSLLEAAGHVDFRDARGPMGFTQRQANGKFTRDEADAFIAALQEGEYESANQSVSPDSGSTPDSAVTEPPANPAKPLSAIEVQLRSVDGALLAAELTRRGWIVVEP